MKKFKGKFKCTYNDGTKQFSTELDTTAHGVEEARRKLYTEFVKIVTQRTEVIFSDKDISYIIEEI